MQQTQRKQENDMLWDHAESLQQLIDMGFPENRARKALQITRCARCRRLNRALTEP